MNESTESHLYRTILDLAGDAIIACSEQGLAIECNQAALDLFCCTREQMIGSSPADWSPEFQPGGRRSDEMANDVFSEVKAQGKCRFEWENQRADGSPLPVDVTVRLAQIDDKVLFIIVSRDITDRKRSDLDLQRSEQMLREVQGVAGLGYYFFDVSTDHWTSSEILDGIFGIGDDYPRDAEHWLELVASDCRMEMRDYLNTVLTRRLPFDREYRIRRLSDGEQRWVHGKGRLHVDGQGNPLTLVGTIQDITERKQMEQALRDSEMRFRHAMEASNDGLWDWDIPSDKTYFSPAYFRMLGYEPGELDMTGQTWADLIHPDDLEAAISANRDCIENRCASFAVEFRMKTKAGSWKWILGRGRAFQRDPAGAAVRMVGTHVDISEGKQAEEKLRDSESRFRDLFENNGSILFVIDPDSGIITAANRAASAYYGYPLERLIGMPISQINTLSPDEVAQERLRAVREERNCFNFLHRLASGEFRHVEVYTTPTKVAGKTQLVSIVHDITERRLLEEQLKRMALYDPLTNLPNRVLFHDHLVRQSTIAKRRGESVGLLFIDLDGFKEVNDQFGHHAGDALLMEVAERLRSGHRAGDLSARLGGDEFVMLLNLTQADPEGEAGRVATRILETVAEPFELDMGTATVSASIGIAIYPLCTESVDQCLRLADMAMYAAKQSGKGRFVMAPERQKGEAKPATAELPIISP